ncbi:tRNA-splicing endonuclease subunit sen54 N-term-domain-containing protein [Mycena floridula]|nr:tRNA-splicing endonuclease subunit sen54 N-term-domain-containing protein [Mycena floridula]
MSDDALSLPTQILPQNEEEGEEDAEEEGEDGALDWSKLAPSTKNTQSRVTIPKRGEKQFEPGSEAVISSETGPNRETALQQRVLQRAREAMFAALGGERGGSSKSLSHAIWYPSLGRAHVVVARGTLVGNIGHSVPRPVEDSDKMHKRLELLPEETIYLVERGSMFCWKARKTEDKAEDAIEMHGIPMTVQQAYTDMIGRDGLTPEKYQVYTYLKRLGYNVTRHEPPTEVYPRAAAFPAAVMAPTSNSYTIPTYPSLFQKIWASTFGRMFAKVRDWWHPVTLPRWMWTGRRDGYSYIFRSLRFIPYGHQIPLFTPEPRKERLSRQEETPYKPFWNVYKPPTPFKKSAPPPPDYMIVVVDARKTSMPSLRELTDLFEIYPEVPVPPPKKRFPPTSASKPSASPQAPRPPSRPTTIIGRISAWILGERKRSGPQTPRGPNPFPALRAGHKMVIIAAVDNGNISFYRFAEGVFGSWEMH